MPVILEFEDATGDPYSVEAAETDGDGPCVHILYFGGGAAPRDILLDRAMAENLHAWIGQWLAEQGQEGGADADSS